MVRLSLSFLLTGASLAFLVSPQLVQARPAASPSPAKALDTFCDKFDRACADTCLNGKTGHVKIAFACAKVSPKNEIFHFGCRCDGKEQTQTALGKISGPVPSSLTVTKSVSTTVTPTVTKPITVTQTVEVDVTSFGTQYTLGDGSGSGSGKVKQNISLLQVKVNKKASTNKAKQPAQSTFCTEYFSSCSRQCSRVKSSPKTQVCKKTDDGSSFDSYNLNCVCKNGKSETQHALEDFGNGGVSVLSKTVTVVGTVTASETVTSSVPVATEVSQSIKVVPSTTLVVLAPTGVVRADGADGGSLYVRGAAFAGEFLELEASRSSAGKVFLVQDPNVPSTGNYGVAFSLQPSTYWSFATFELDVPDFRPQRKRVAHREDYSCITPSGASVPPSSTDYYQTFSWVAGDIESNPDSDTPDSKQVKLSPRWSQGDGTFLDKPLHNIDGASCAVDSDYYYGEPLTFYLELDS